MVKQIQLELRNVFDCKFICNGDLVAISTKKKVHDFIVPCTPAHCKFEINPWKLEPIIRIDGQFVNYGLAGITPWDHMLELTLTDDFLDRYFQNTLQAKSQYLKLSLEETYKKTGYKQSYDELVKNIRENIK